MDNLMKNEQVAVATTTAKKDGAFLSGLRVRVKELAQEARFIRHEEIKAKPKNREEFWLLRNHRVVEVRNAARAAQLAYGFLSGIPYRKIEAKTYTSSWEMHKIKKEAKRLATKFGNKNYDDEVDIWFQSVTVE